MAGPPFNSATALQNGTAANTVFWYTGESGPTPARQTATAQVGPSTTVAYGMRANEPAFGTMVANIAALAATSYSPANANAAASYSALVSRVSSNLSIQQGAQSIEDVDADIANAQVTVTNAQSVNTADAKHAHRHAAEGRRRLIRSNRCADPAAAEQLAGVALDDGAALLAHPRHLPGREHRLVNSGKGPALAERGWNGVFGPKNAPEAQALHVLGYR